MLLIINSILLVVCVASVIVSKDAFRRAVSAVMAGCLAVFIFTPPDHAFRPVVWGAIIAMIVLDAANSFSRRH